jgi:HD-GYP domain-containing protein (c-di-GMP phosphodiesterase class II)
VNAGGLWNKDGQKIALGGSAEETEEDSAEIAPPPRTPPDKPRKPEALSEIDQKIEEIVELKEVASAKYSRAKECIKGVLSSIEETGGEFDFEPIADTVLDLFDFVSHNENAFSFLTKEIFSYDDYLYNHSINVCTIGTVILKKFNTNFSGVVNGVLNNLSGSAMQMGEVQDNSAFAFYLPDEMRDISIGFFMHDLGKILIDKKILNKPGKLTDSEFEEMKSHSSSKGLELLEKNKLVNPYIKNISLYHHSQLFEEEEGCYPLTKGPREIPAYVKVCKLADMYDAMTSKRCYKDAFNPVSVVADIFHKYAEKDRLLQHILHSFVNSVGIYPPGSIVLLTNGQMAYVLDSAGPALLPITDAQGTTLQKKQDMLVLVKGAGLSDLKVDRRKAPLAPTEAFKMLPDYLVKTIFPDTLANKFSAAAN